MPSRMVLTVERDFRWVRGLGGLGGRGPSSHRWRSSQLWRSLRGSGHPGPCVSFRADLFAH